MNKKILLIISIVSLLVLFVTTAFACSSSNTVTEKNYNSMIKYYNNVLNDVKKIEKVTEQLSANLNASTFSASFHFVRYYHSTSIDNRIFLGTQQSAGYDKVENSEWLVDSVNYTIKYKNGDIKIEAKVNKIVNADKYDAKKEQLANTYIYKKVGENETFDGGDESIVKKYCIEYVYDTLFEFLNDKQDREAHSTAASGGLRIYMYIQQYQTTKAYPYKEDGTIDKDKVIEYTQNKDKIKYSALTEVYDESAKNLYFTLNNEVKDIKGEDVTYWDNYGEDIGYNFYKIAAVENTKSTIRYKNKSKQIESYEYYGEIVLPYYTQKSDFKTYNVIKARVADYYNYVIKFDYSSNVEI